MIISESWPVKRFQRCLNDACKPKKHDEGDNADHDVADLLELAIHRDVIENKRNNE